ncbi:MAG: hypothetical protein IPH75_02335 [bacterium]|nr:hypothetical protein [bacterium]
MADPGIRLRISAPTDLFLQGRGFYQLEEDSLYLQLETVTEKGHFFSYLEAPNCRLDFDIAGRLLFLEINAARHTWHVIDNLDLPTSIGFADIHCLDFRRQIPDPFLSTTSDRSSLTITFESSPVARAFRLSNSVIIQTTAEDCLRSITITDIVDDLAGQEIAAFRNELAAKGKPTG